MVTQISKRTRGVSSRPPACCRPLAAALDHRLFKALGDPTRLRVAHALLVGDELCVCDLAWVVGASQGLVSHHLRQLRTNGLVSSRRDGKLVMYRLTDLGRQLLTTVGELETKAGA